MEARILRSKTMFKVCLQTHIKELKALISRKSLLMTATVKDLLYSKEYIEREKQNFNRHVFKTVICVLRSFVRKSKTK